MGGGEGTGIYNWCFREDVMLWSFSVSIYMSVRIFLYGANIKQNTFLYDWCIMEERYLTFLSNNIILCLLCPKIWTHYSNTINALRDYSMLKLCVFQLQVWFRFPVENPISLKHKFMWARVYRRLMNLILSLIFCSCCWWPLHAIWTSIESKINSTKSFSLLPVVTACMIGKLMQHCLQ